MSAPGGRGNPSSRRPARSGPGGSGPPRSARSGPAGTRSGAGGRGVGGAGGSSRRDSGSPPTDWRGDAPGPSASRRGVSGPSVSTRSTRQGPSRGGPSPSSDRGARNPNLSATGRSAGQGRDTAFTRTAVAPTSLRGPRTSGGGERGGGRGGDGSGGLGLAGRSRGPARGDTARGDRSGGERSGGSEHLGPAANNGRGVGGEQVEGRQAVRELLVAGRRRVREVLLVAELDDAPILEDIRELCVARRVPLREVGRSRFDALTATQSAQGVLARAQSLPEYTLEDLLRSRRGGTKPFLIALDGVTDPGNLGALLRSAEGSGVSGVILPRHRAVHVTPAVTKAAAGAVEYVRIALVGGLPTTITQLNEAGVWTIGLDGSTTTSLYSLPLDDQPVCLVFGAEGKGLSRLVKERCAQLAGIPLGGQLNSLNVAAAAAVSCFEIARQREVGRLQARATLEAGLRQRAARAEHGELAVGELAVGGEFGDGFEQV